MRAVHLLSLSPRAAIVVAALSIGLAPIAVDAAPTCRSESERPQVFVRAKSAVRRGPGLNYAPSAVLDDGRCVALIEVSLDESWVLVEDDDKKLFGWVPASAIDPDSRANLDGAKAKSAPIGSGQERGYVSMAAASSLRTGPDVKAGAKKVLPEGSRLLALATTEDARWVEVRDERGETGWVAAESLTDPSGTLAGLPRTAAGLKTGLEPGGADPESVVRGRGTAPSEDRSTHAREDRSTHTSETRLVEPGPVAPAASGGVAAEVRVLATAALPRHVLDSNGAAANRRYTVRAQAAGGRFELLVGPIAELRVRLSYAFLFLPGLEPTGDATQSVGGQTHEGGLVVGYPIQLDGLRIVPEAGYDFSLFAMEPSLPRDPVPLFVSSHAHGLTLGAQVAFDVVDGLVLEVAGAGVAGLTLDYPFDIGGSGLSLGARASTGVRVDVSEGIALVASYELLFRHAPFSGASVQDPTITEATLSHLAHGLSVGVAFGP